MTPIKYIGHRKNFHDNIYGTGIAFEQGSTALIEDDQVARKMLKHTDVYVRGDEADAEVVAGSEKKPTSKAGEDDQDQIARDAIANMTKQALATYALTHFSAKLNMQKKVGDLRTEVTGMFDRFGTD